MAGFLDKLQKLLPETLSSINNTADALRDPGSSEFMGGGMGLGALAGGAVGLLAGVAAAVSTLAVPLASLSVLSLAGGLAAPFVLPVLGGVLGVGIGYAVGAVARVGLGALGAAFLAAGETGEALANKLSRRTKNFAGTGLKWGGLAGAALGLVAGVAAFAAAPAVGTAFGIFAMIMGRAGLLGGATAAVSLTAAAVMNGIDAVRGRDPSLNSSQEKAAKELVRTRNARIGSEDLLESYAREGWMPNLAQALPQDVYGKLSDKGKLSALSAVFDACGKDLMQAPDEKDDPGSKERIKAAFNGFAQNARTILASEQERDAALSPGARRKEETLQRARDKALEIPANRVVRGPFGEVVKQY